MHGKNRVSAWKGVGTTFMITLKILKNEGGNSAKVENLMLVNDKLIDL